MAQENDSASSCGGSPRHTSGSLSPGSPSAVTVGAAASPQAAADEFLQKEKIEATKEAALEAESKAAQLRATLPLEQRMQQFKEMLVEKEISAYSTWEKELQKIVFDPRYLLLTSKERKSVFDKYVRDRAEHESKEKAAALKRKRDDYRAMLAEAGLTLANVASSTSSSSSSSSSSSVVALVTFAEIATRYAKDERLRGIEKLKDRELLYNEYVAELRKQDKDDKQAEKERAKRAFVAMLKELAKLHRHSSWGETKRLLEADARYKAVADSYKREDYFREFCKHLDEKPKEKDVTTKSRDKEKEKEKDKHRDSSSKHHSSSSSKEKRRDHHDDDDEKHEEKEEGVVAASKATSKSRRTPDTKDDNNKEDKENNDGELIDDDEATVAAASRGGGDDDGDEEEEEEEKRRAEEEEKRARVEASLRSRTEQVKKQLSEYQSEREKERDLLRHDEAVECFKALLIDIIKLNVATVKEDKKKDSKDKDKDKDNDDAANLDDQDDHEVVDDDDGVAMVTESPAKAGSKTKTAELSWKEAKKILKRDARWSHCRVLDKELKERLYDQHMQKFRAKKRELFAQLLDETAGIVMRTSVWRDVKRLVRHDARFVKLQQSESSFKMEREFEHYMHDKFQRAKHDLKQLLAHTKCITHKSYGLIKEFSQKSSSEQQQQPNHLKEIMDVLAMDKAYTVLECATEERRKILMDYIEHLHDEGPPPPPTATEPSKRK